MLLASRPFTAPRARRALTLTFAVAATAGLTACAGQSTSDAPEFTGAKGKVQDVVKRLADLAERDDAAGICKDVFDPALIKALGGTDCAKNVQQAINAADYTRLNVSSITIDAGETTAIAQIKPVETTTKARRSVTLTRKAKTDPWTISGLDPNGTSVLPGGSTPASTTPAQTTPASTPKS